MSKKYHDSIIDNREGENKNLDREDLLGILIRSLKDPKVLDEYEDEEITIHYESLTVWGDQIYAASWDGPAEYDEIDDYEYDYEPDFDRLTEYLYDRLLDDEEIVKIITDFDDSTVADWVNKFVVSLSLLYEEDVVDLFCEDAEEGAQEDFDEKREDARAEAEADAAEAAAEARWEAMLDRYDL